MKNWDDVAIVAVLSLAFVGLCFSVRGCVETQDRESTARSAVQAEVRKAELAAERRGECVCSD